MKTQVDFYVSEKVMQLTRQFVIAFSSLLLIFTSVPLYATAYTPLSWQEVVKSHSNPILIGQHKHLTWVRDQNRNFIDDEIEARFGPKDHTNIILALNRCLPPAQVQEIFSRYGKITYIGKLVSFVFLNDVPVSDLSALAARPEVAMIEWQVPETLELDVASRAIQAHASAQYLNQSAQDLGLTGSGVNIAIVDTGVNDGSLNTLPSSAFVAGYDAWDSTDSGNGLRNPTDTVGNHGTTMAVMALGRGVAGQTCRNPGGGPAANCAGIAPGAGLIDVNRCGTTSSGSSVQYNCDSAFTARAVDWVGINAQKFKIRVVNLSFSRCVDDDGKDALSQQANYLSALGLVVVASYANANNGTASCPASSPGTKITKPPASASFAISVNATDDKNTVARSDDTHWTNYLTGPRKDFNFTSPNLLALKPDLSAPGENLSTTTLTGIPGTSPAAAMTSGAAALVLQKFPAMTPDSLKQLLITSADNSRNTPYSSTTGVWDTALGWGLLSVGAALQNAMAQSTDVRFPNCQSGGASGQPCPLKSGDPAWNNQVDITTNTPAKAGVPNQINVKIENTGNSPITILVNFGVYSFAVGNNQFHHLGTKQVTINPHATLPVSQVWTPAFSDHQCAQISIAYGLDADYTNNVTQRNLQISPSVYNVRVENSLMAPARFEIKAVSDRAGWRCTVSDAAFALDPFTDCARNVKVAFNAPAGTRPGRQANCNIAVYATPNDGERRLIGGVTVRTYVPRPCRAFGEVVDANGHPVAGARILTKLASPGKATFLYREALAMTNRDGVFSLSIVPDVPQTFSVQRAGVGRGKVILRPGCGLDLPRLVLTAQGLRAEPIRYAGGSE
ncbi:MAG: S8 family serine peptidase [Gammaproteobacteria bacterium]